MIPNIHTAKMFNNRLMIVCEEKRKMDVLEYENGELTRMMEENDTLNYGRDNKLHSRIHRHLTKELARNIKEIEELTERVAAVQL